MATKYKFTKFVLHRGLYKSSVSGTIGSLYGVDILGLYHFVCNTLEPYHTVVPAQTYSVCNTFSPRFNKYLPLLCSVPGHSGIRIHCGNTVKDTSGCILLGQYDSVSHSLVGSRIAFDEFIDLAKFPLKLTIL